MAIFRVIKDKDNPYVIKNTYYDFDSRLSLKAKGLMGIFLSRPNDWEFYHNEVLKHCKDGKDSLNSAINELIQNGYIERYLKRDEKGKLLGGYDYSVYEMPKNRLDNTTCTKSAESGKTEIGKNRNRKKPFSENPPLLNNELKLNNENKSSSSNIKVFKHFEKCKFGMLSPILMEKIAVDIEIYGAVEVMKAAEIADENGKHSYNYCKGILEKRRANIDSSNGRNTKQDHVASKKQKYDFESKFNRKTDETITDIDF